VANFLWSGGDLEEQEMLNGELDEEGQALLKEYREMASTSGVEKVSAIMIRSPDPPKALVEKLREIRPNFVVMGASSNKGIIKQALLGSTTKYVRDNVDFPIEVVEHDLEKQ
jgi:nucleotide-binding universal stress UspA family protein